MTRLSVEMLAADAPEPITSAGHAQLGIAVLAGIAVIVLLITKFKLHAFLSLTIGSLALGAFAGAPLDKVIASFSAGLGSTFAGVGVLIALGAIVVAMIGSVVLGLAQELVFSLEVEEQQPIVDLVERGDPFEIALLAVSAVLLAPVTEELLFRHMFFRRLLQRVGPAAAWTIPALAFALAHWNPVGLLVYVWLGSVFAGAYVLSGRLWVAMLAHAGHNAFALTMLLYAPEALP